ncbi:MAG: DUF3108 domain-containing protein [Pseudomonadota bacterium]|nr:DUF3108 domain-containing protein [Pseudomonadota bacterium]
MKHYFFNTLVLMLLSCPALAGEAGSPINFKGIYICTFSGIPIGKMGIDIEQTPGHYAVAADITTSGLLRLFVKHQSHSTTEASGEHFIYPAIEYETHYQTRGKKHYIRLVRKNGRVQETQIPPENHVTRPAVPAAILKNAVDPLSLIIEAREKLQEALTAPSTPVGEGRGEGASSIRDPRPLTPSHRGREEFFINVYDGNRLSEADFIILGKKIIFYGTGKLPVIAVAARRKPLAGFTRKELAGFGPDDPTLYIYFSDDAKLMPLKLQMALPFGLLTATLAKECLNGESCLLGIKQAPNSAMGSKR